MSRGGYTSAIDVWSAGCIFGELLQRLSRVGSATTPHLQVAPLFAIHGVPKTPPEGCALENPLENPSCRRACRVSGRPRRSSPSTACLVRPPRGARSRMRNPSRTLLLPRLQGSMQVARLFRHGVPRAQAHVCIRMCKMRRRGAAPQMHCCSTAMILLLTITALPCSCSPHGPDKVGPSMAPAR